MDVDTDSAETIVCHEYTTQFFEFVSRELVDSIYNEVDARLAEAVETFETSCMLELGDAVSEKKLIKEGDDLLEKTVKPKLEKAFEKFEKYIIHNVLGVPDNMVLPEDDVHIQATCSVEEDVVRTQATGSVEDEVELDKEIIVLEQEIINAKYCNAFLTQELMDVDTILNAYSEFGKELKSVDEISSKNGMDNITEFFHDTNKKLDYFSKNFVKNN